MANLNIKFNNKNYSIDSAALADAIASLEGHLVAMMGGSGDSDSIVGTWVFNDELIAEPTGTTYDFAFNFDGYANTTGGMGVRYTSYGPSAPHLTYITDYYPEGQIGNYRSIAVYAFDETYNGTVGWQKEEYKTITITEELTDEAFITWLKANATHVGGSTPDEERLGGDGAEFYTLAPTALSFRSTAPLNELQEVQINGVTVDPANYTLEEGSTIVTFPIDYLKTLNIGSYEVAVASDSKTVKGDFNVKAPELNEHGFYYNQPYTAYIEAFLGNCIFFFRKDGTMDFINGDGSVEICSYTYSNNSIIVYTSLGTFNGSVSAGGMEVYCIELNITFKLGDNSIIADKDYIYTYDDSLGGYVVNAIDKTSTSYDTIRTGIYNMPTVKLSERIFANHDANAGWGEIETVLVTAPIIPNSVVIIGDCAFLRRTGFSSITLPGNLISIGWKAFEGCYDLTNITFEGTMEQWNAITKGTDWNYNVPATHVHCTDGDVAL